MAKEKRVCSVCKVKALYRENTSGMCQPCFKASGNGQAPAKPATTVEDVFRVVKNASPRKGGLTPEEIGRVLSISPGAALDHLLSLKTSGRSIFQFGDRWSLSVAPSGDTFDRPLTSDDDGWHKFGAMGDTHMGSKQERIAELHDFYRIVEKNEIATVLHTGNYIDGESRFNRHELKVHGMDAQLAYMGEHYPQIDGVETLMVSGDDHEGWYGQREGVDIGFYMQSVMERGGRHDLKNLGYMECFITLKHKQTGASTRLHVVHPGGGSAYAISYTMQKQIEAYEGGEKPSIVLAGHYHKAEHLESRNVHGFQTGCFQDQTTFMRKKKLIATIGGWIVFARQNAETGAVEEVFSYFKGYYNRGYYVNNRWSLSGPVSLVPRIKL